MPTELPAWLLDASAYEPLKDRAGFLRKNVLSLTSVLLALRADPTQGAASTLDSVLNRVSPPVRLVAVLTLVLCVSLARNMAFVWMALVAWLVLLALRPASRIRPIAGASFGIALVTLLVNLPSLLLGQTATPVRMASKSLVTVGFVVSLATSLGTEGMLAALHALHVPRRLLMVVDLAVRDVVLMGEAAVSLSEALALRSVGKDRTKTSSAAGVMGVVFVHAHTMAQARAEAMELRGYSGVVAIGTTSAKMGVPDAAYALLAAMAVALFAYLEIAIA